MVKRDATMPRWATRRCSPALPAGRCRHRRRLPPCAGRAATLQLELRPYIAAAERNASGEQSTCQYGERRRLNAARAFCVCLSAARRTLACCCSAGLLTACCGRSCALLLQFMTNRLLGRKQFVLDVLHPGKANVSKVRRWGRAHVHFVLFCSLACCLEVHGWGAHVLHATAQQAAVKHWQQQRQHGLQRQHLGSAATWNWEQSTA